MSRIISLTAENIMRLSAVHIEPSGNVVKIAGRNGQGKSSVLNAIAMALGGMDEVPAEPIHAGTDRARVILETEDFVITRTFTTRGSELVVKDRKGMKATGPQSLLNRLASKCTFDPLAFLRLDPSKQKTQLMTLLGLDFAEEDHHRKQLYDERTAVNRQLADATALFNSLPHHQDAPATEVSMTELIAELEKAQAANQRVHDLAAAAEKARGAMFDAQQEADDIANQRKEHALKATSLSAKRSALQDADADLSAVESGDLAPYVEFSSELSALRARMNRTVDAINNTLAAAPQEDARLAAELDRLNKAFHAVADAAAAAEKEAEAAETVDLQPIRDRIAQADQVNAKARANAKRTEQEALVDRLTGQSNDLTAAIEHIDRQKAEKIAAAPFPVPGLSFDANGLRFNGSPFSQASDAEKRRVSFAMACALNPELRIALIRDASLLDDESLADIARLAEEHDMQVWLELVGKGDATAIVIEDGAVLQPAAPAEGNAS